MSEEPTQDLWPCLCGICGAPATGQVGYGGLYPVCGKDACYFDAPSWVELFEERDALRARAEKAEAERDEAKQMLLDYDSKLRLEKATSELTMEYWSNSVKEAKELRRGRAR